MTLKPVSEVLDNLDAFGDILERENAEGVLTQDRLSTYKAIDGMIDASMRKRFEEKSFLEHRDEYNKGYNQARNDYRIELKTLFNINE